MQLELARLSLTHAGAQVSLGHLCVDVIKRVPEVPLAEEVKTAAFLARLTSELSRASSADLELGAQCNVLLAAVRLGLRCAAVCSLGEDMAGAFLRRELQVLALRCPRSPQRLHCVAPHVSAAVPAQAEGVSRIESLDGQPLASTLMCFVLVDPAAAHAFCSAYDLGPHPLLPGIDGLSPDALQVGVRCRRPGSPGVLLHGLACGAGLPLGPTSCGRRPQHQQVLADTEVLALNGFVFDELRAEVVLGAVQHAARCGAAIFCDPGPRAWTLPKAVLDAAVRSSHAVFMTQVGLLTCVHLCRRLAGIEHTSQLRACSRCLAQWHACACPPLYWKMPHMAVSVCAELLCS